MDIILVVKGRKPNKYHKLQIEILVLSGEGKKGMHLDMGAQALWSVSIILYVFEIKFQNLKLIKYKHLFKLRCESYDIVLFPPFIWNSS